MLFQRRLYLKSSKGLHDDSHWSSRLLKEREKKVVYRPDITAELTNYISKCDVVLL